MKRFFAFLLLLSAFSYGELGVRIAEGTPPAVLSWGKGVRIRLH